MKSVKRFFLHTFIPLFLLLALTLPLLVSCQNKNPDSYVGKKDTLKLTKKELADLCIVYNIRALSDETDVLDGFLRKLKDTFGTDVACEDDMHEHNKTYEILFGSPDSETYKNMTQDLSLRDGDFFIGYADKKVVITAGSANGLQSAVDFLFANCYGKDAFFIPKKHLAEKNYTVKSATFAQNDFLKTPYSLVVRSGASEAATLLRNTVSDLCGITLKISSSASYKHIYIGTRKNETATSGAYTVECDENGNVYIAATDVADTAKAVELFLYKVFGCDGISGTAAETVLLPAGTISYGAADYNTLQTVRLAQYTKKTLYVSAGAAAGGNGSAEAPYATLTEAVNAAHAIIAETDRMNITIAMDSGTHRLTDTAIFSGADIGDKRYYLTLKGDGDNTIVTSGVQVPGTAFTQVNGKNYYAYQLPSSYIRNGQYPALRDLSVNGNLLTLARSAGEKLMALDAYKGEVTEITDKNGNVTETVTPVSEDEHILYLDAELLSRYENESDIRDAELWIKVEWQIHAVHIDYIDRQKTERDSDNNLLYAVKIREEDWNALMGDPTSNKRNYYSTLKNRGYWIANDVHFLTENNTFVYDRENGTFYVIPPKNSNISDLTFEIPMLNTLLSFSAAENVRIENLAFTGITNTYIADNGYITGQCGYLKTGNTGFLPYAAVYGENINEFTVSDCLFVNLSCDGVSFRGAVDNLTVTGNDFKNIGGSAIRVGNNNGTYSAKNHNYNIVIENNLAENTGMIYTSNAAIFVSCVQKLSLCHNTIRHSAYSGISVGWSWSPMKNAGGINVKYAEIAYNYIDGFMCGMKDGGAIYAVGGNSPFNENEDVYFNFIHDNYCVVSPETATLADEPTGGYTVLYLDGSSSNWRMSRNVIMTLHETNPTKFSYLSYQSVPGQQAYNNMSDENYIIGIPDARETQWIFGDGLNEEKSVLYRLYSENNTIITDKSLLRSAYSDVVDIIEASGCENDPGVLTDN